MNTQTIAVFSKGVSGGVLELAREAKAGNFRTLLFTNQESAEKMANMKLFGQIFGLPSKKMYDNQTLIDLFLEQFRKNKIETVFCCYDPFGPAVCDILKTHYGLASESEHLKSCYFKSIVRQQLNSKGIDDLPFFEIRAAQDLEKLKDKIVMSRNSKWILKPSFGTSSELVSQPLNSYDELKKFYELISKSGRHHIKKMYLNDTNWADVYLLERFVDGEEYSVEGICINDKILVAGAVQKQGMTIVNGIRSEGVNFVPIKDVSRFNALSDLARKTVKSLQLSNAPFHIEMRWDKLANRPRVIEINPRLPGGLLCNIHKDRHGVNLARLFLYSRLGIKKNRAEPKVDDRFYGDLPLPTTKAGIYKGVAIPNRFKQEAAMYGEIEIIDFLAKGEVLDPSQSEVYFAHAYIRAGSEEKFWNAVKLCEKIAPVIN